MDKKDDNKKPSKKDKKKDKKDKKDKKKKIVKKKNDDKISQSQIVNIKIGDISKPKTRSRRKAAPKAAPPPPQIQRQLQYLPSLAGQAPMIPPPLAPAPTPPPAAPAPPRPPAPAAEPRRTGDFFSDTSKSSVYGTSFDLSSATLDDLTSVGRGASRPSMTRAFNRPRSDSGVSALTDPTYADFDNFSDFNATAPSRFGSSYDLQTTAPPQNVELLGQFSDRTQGAETQDSVIRKLAYDYDMPVVENLEDFDLKEPRLRLQGVTQSSGEEEQIIRTVRPMKDDDSVATQFGFNLSRSTQPEESLGAGADFENIAAPSVVNVSDNLGFVSSQQPQQIQELQPTQTPPEAQPIEGQLVEAPVVAVIEDPMISEPLQAQAQAVKGDVKPEDEATGGGGKKEALIFSDLTTEQKNTLFSMYDNEKFEKKVKGQADAISRYNLKTKRGDKISTQQFSKEYLKWKDSEKSKKGKK